MNLVELLDRGAETIVLSLHRPWLDAVMIAATHLGDRETLAAVTLLAVVALFILRKWRTAALFTVVVLASFLLSQEVKVLVGRPRPDVPWRPVEYSLPSSASFPSGHALESMTVYGSLALTLGRRLRARWLRGTFLFLGLGLPLVIGFSRVYLGVHYYTDVLAGWVAGLLLALLVAWADSRWERGKAARANLSSSGKEAAVK